MRSPGRRKFLGLLVGGLAACVSRSDERGSAAVVTPGRAALAPLVTIKQVLEIDSLLGRRVRVTGACALMGSGPSTGAWVLAADGFSVEVLGLVPQSCQPGEDAEQPLTIFAQVEPKGQSGTERLLLRLPD